MKCGGGYGEEIPCVYKFTGQPRKVDTLNKLLDIPNNRSVRKEQEMDWKRIAIVEGSRRRPNNFESLKILQSEVFQIFCIIYSFILFTEHCNVADVMLTTNTFA